MTVAVVVIAVWRPPGTSARGFDYWAHAAAIREWGLDLADPGHPQLATDDPSPRYVPSLFPAALAMRLFGIDAVAGMAVAAAVGMALLLAGSYAFLRAYFADERAPLVGLVLLLGGWGLAAPGRGCTSCGACCTRPDIPPRPGSGWRC